MAKPIKVTPVLRGRDAINFYARLEENKNKKVSQEFIYNIKLASEKFQESLKRSK